MKKRRRNIGGDKKKNIEIEILFGFFLYVRYLFKIWFLIILYFRYDLSCFY